MSFEYCFRLLCLSLASFFLIHVTLGLAVIAIGPAMIRAAGRMRARAAACLMLAMRLGPGGIAFLAVGLLCVPSYLWLEPEAAEPIGAGCFAAAIGGAAIVAIAVARALRAAVASAVCLGRCRRVGRRVFLRGEALPVWILDQETSVFALTGIIRPRLVISRAVMRVLSREQLTAALHHEHAHRRSHDNLKRLLVLAAPGILPFWRGFGALERAWSRYTEWAADDAAAEDSRASVSLAGALVRVARISAARPANAIVAVGTSLLANRDDLAERVDRLLRRGPALERRGRGSRAVRAAAVIAGLLAIGLVILHPATLGSVHALLELLNR